MTDRKPSDGAREAKKIPTHPRELQKDVEQRRMTDRGTDPGTSEPGMPPRTDTDDDER